MRKHRGLDLYSLLKTLNILTNNHLQFIVAKKSVSLASLLTLFQVISPCFIPQPNGPPILVNLPSYIYPNIGMMGGMLAAAGTSTSGPLTSSASHFLSASSTTTTTATTSNAGFSFVPTLSNVPSLPSNLLPQHPVSFASASSPINSLVCTYFYYNVNLHTIPGRPQMRARWGTAPLAGQNSVFFDFFERKYIVCFCPAPLENFTLQWNKSCGLP